MFNQNGNEQDLANFQPEKNTNAMQCQQQKKMPPSAFVQIVIAGPFQGPVKVRLSQNCSTVAEHAAFLLKEINKSKGNWFGIPLYCPVQLASVFDGDEALLDHNLPLEVGSKYTFIFTLVNQANKPDQAEELAAQMAQLAIEKEELKKFVEGKMVEFTEEQAKQHSRVEQLEKLLKEEAEKVAKLAEEQAKCQAQLDQLEKENDTLKLWKEEEQKKWEKQLKLLGVEEAKEEKEMASAEYALLIGVPILANLVGNYDKKKLLQLIQHGKGAAAPSIYIQNNQKLKDAGIVQSIVDLLATAEKPAKMVEQVTVEAGGVAFTWPKREEMKFKQKMSNVACTFNEASDQASSCSGKFLAEYELINRGCRFQVFIHYWNEETSFNKSLTKFIYRRLP